jgi:hypothetical protein
MKRILILVVTAVWSACVMSADSDEVSNGSFEGSVIVEWLDDPYVLKMRMVEELAFHQAGGKSWVVPVNAVVDGRSMPRLFVSLTGRPFNSAFRKTTLVYDYAAKSKQHSWDEAQSMFYEGALTEGVVPVEAKVIYMLLNATGLRWAVRGDRDCYGRCHPRDANLEWSPKVNEEEVLALVSWVRSEDPPLDEIERRVGKVILDDSPHMIGRIHIAPEQ